MLELEIITDHKVIIEYKPLEPIYKIFVAIEQ